MKCDRHLQGVHKAWISVSGLASSIPVSSFIEGLGCRIDGVRVNKRSS